MRRDERVRVVADAEGEIRRLGLVRSLKLRPVAAERGRGGVTPVATIRPFGCDESVLDGSEGVLYLGVDGVGVEVPRCDEGEPRLSALRLAVPRREESVRVVERDGLGEVARAVEPGLEL